jgi:hypothetical protein
VWLCQVSLHGQAAMHEENSPFKLFSRSTILFRLSLVKWLGLYLGLVSLLYRSAPFTRDFRALLFWRMGESGTNKEIIGNYLNSLLHFQSFGFETLLRIIPYIPVQPTRCHFSQFIYFSNTLHVSGGTSTHHQELGLYVWLLVFAKPCCYLLRSWLGWNWLKTMIATGSGKVWQIPEAIRTVRALDDGWRFHPKHVESYWNK